MNKSLTAFSLLLALVAATTFADTNPTVSNGKYSLACTDGFSDGGQMNATGTLKVTNGKIVGKLKTNLIVYADGVDAPEQEIHTFPTLDVSGTAKLIEGPFTKIDGRPARIEMSLDAINWSVKDQFADMQLIDNSVRGKDSDDEQSELRYAGRRFSGVCTIKKL